MAAPSRLAIAIEETVRTAVEDTLARRAAETAEDMARELLKEPEFRQEMQTLLRAAFRLALVDLTRPITGGQP